MALMLVVTVLQVPVATAAEDDDAAMQLTLRDCIEIALKHNMDIEVSRFDPRIPNTTSYPAGGSFDPTVYLSPRHNEEDLLTYFGDDVPNFPPYTWFENDRVTEVPTVPKPEDMYGLNGDAVPGWDLEAVLPERTRRAGQTIDDAGDDPFFLYFPLTSPPTPLVPTAAFRGRTDRCAYTECISPVDWRVVARRDRLRPAAAAAVGRLSPALITPAGLLGLARELVLTSNNPRTGADLAQFLLYRSGEYLRNRGASGH